MAIMKDDTDLEDKGVEPEDTETEAEETPEPIREPVDKNESVEVQVQTRADKKRNRFREVEERATKAERDAEEARRESREARERLDRLQAVPGQQQQQPNPVAAKLAQLAEGKRQLVAHYTARASQPGYDPNSQEHKDFERRAQDFDDARQAVIAQASAPQINKEDWIREAQLRSYLNDHADISQDKQKMQWAIARWQQNIAEGKADTKAMSDAVFDEARIKFGLQPRNRRGSRPDDATKRRLTGVSSQSAGGSNAPSKISMSAMERKMAQVKYDKDPPSVAWQKWANNEGKRIMEKRSAKSG